MSETENPTEVPVTMAANGTGPPEDTGGKAVTGKADEKENGTKTAAEEEEETHGKKDENVYMVDAVDVKVEKEDKEDNGMEEEEPMKVEGEEKETDEHKDGQETEEKSEVMKEKDKDIEAKSEDVEEKGSEAEGGNEECTEKKGKELEEKDEEVDDKGEKAEEKSEKVEESEEKGEEAEDKGEEAEEKTEKGEESEEKGEEAEDKGEEAEENGEDGNEEKIEENAQKGTRKRMRRSHKAAKKGELKKESAKTKEVLKTLTTSSIDRPVRERKTVERLVEVVEKEPAKGFLIEKGRGTLLKDIPNVAYKLSKRKPDDIRLLHQLLFGRKGKAINFKSHIFQFSGFVWHDNEEKQRTRVKEKLDKCVKDKLLDLCDMFDIPVSRPTLRKEDLVAKLLDFMVAPHATTDVMLAEKEQLTKSRKRKRVPRRSAWRRRVSIPGKRSRKKRVKSEDTSKAEKNTTDAEDEDDSEDGDGDGEEKENGLPDEDEAIKHSESEEDESEHKDVKEDEYSGKDRRRRKKSSKMQSSSLTAKSKKVTSPKKAPLPAPTKSPTKPSSKRFKVDEAEDSNEKVFSRKKKDVVTPKKKSTSRNPDLKEEKTTGKKAGRGKAKSNQAEKLGPSEEELRKTICEILKEVDFNTATFTDIVKKLASHYHMDLTDRKTSIKLIIQDELTKLAEEAEDEEDEDEDEGDDEKAENLEATGKEVEA